jgi:enoyl-CoA hydratase/carnithine racemase
MEYRETLYHVDGKVAVITLNRPDKLNAWTGRMAEEIQHCSHWRWSRLFSRSRYVGSAKHPGR